MSSGPPEPSGSHTAKPNVVEDLVKAGTAAFNPSGSPESRDDGLQKYNDLIKRTDTWTLLHALNALIQPGATQAWLRPALMRSLTLIPLRKDGVRATMELVFMVHPSTSRGAKDSKESQKQGANITQESVAVATKLLSTVPSDMSPEAWFGGISEQIFSLIDGSSGPELSQTAAQIVGYGILGKRSLGAPGAAGWSIFVQPIIDNINWSLREDRGDEALEEEEVVDLTRGRRLVSSDDLQRSVQRLKILILSNPSPGLCKRVLTRVLPQLWTLASWPAQQGEVVKGLKIPASVLLQTYFKLFGESESIMVLIQNLMCQGSLPSSKTAWKYLSINSDEIEAVEAQRSEESVVDWGKIDANASNFVDLFTSASSTEDISSIFLKLLRKWIESSSAEQNPNIEVVLSSPTESPSSTISDLVEVAVLQKLMQKAPEKLVSHFDQLLDLVTQVFIADTKSPLGDDVVGIVLSLLNLVITVPSFQKSDIKSDQLTILESSLERISQQDRSDTSATARNLSLLLKYRDELEEPDDAASLPSARQIEDRKTYSLAMSYIAGEKDNPPPVVSEGLNLLSGLINSQSPILDINGITTLMSSLLKDKEDYINLRVIKIFTELSNKHPKSTLQELTDSYLDSSEKLSTDTRLRFGEALVQVIERLGELFTGDAAHRTSEALLSIAGRRGYRAKTYAKQKRDEKLRKLKEDKGQAEDDEPDMDLDEEDLTEEQKANNDVIARIIEGWDSQRGSEDIRMRTSALSIFGLAVETNIRGIGATLASAGVDLALNILAMERDTSSGILRRAAIISILSFVRALNTAREPGQSLGFGLTEESRGNIQRTLEYIAATDNDGLVQQHAHDVVESLDNWRLASLALDGTETSSGFGSSGLTNLAGLHVKPSLGDEQGVSTSRPRIEEIE
ncbi:hypothetical protein VHEMI00144 [[Torrubiella] hemipterigena]|uniref:Protein required for cell viability n=1 Tax=[Torrubiella] hemipterigena TaxID=1531966 RepID=A0A0A1SIF5_9HYPO|nr:hypothetical protein VHEMI00144 [[Torrubiella] hemipterigena]